MNKLRNYALTVLIFLPMIILLLLGKEFWPFTSFPMYSQPYKSFNWPRVFVKKSSDSNWQLLINEKCYGRIGYVRFHFSILRFSKENRQQAINDLSTSLAKEVRLRCKDLEWMYLKVSISNFNTNSQGSPNENFLKNVTEEIRIEI